MVIIAQIQCMDIYKNITNHMYHGMMGQF